jgi:hypothetical protein
VKRAILIMLLAIAGSAHAQPLPSPVDPDAPTVSLRPEKGKVQIGEAFHIWITVLHKPDMTVTLEPQDRYGTFERLDRKEHPEPQPDGLVKSVYDLTVAGFEVGKQAFPSLSIGYEVNKEQRKVDTDSIEIDVVSVVADGKEELKPIAPPVSILQKDYTLAWIAGGIAAAILCATFGWWLAGRLRRRRRVIASEIAAMKLPPDEHALARLFATREELAAVGDDADLRPICFTLSEIVREYIGRRFAFDSLELTTRELVDTLDAKAGQLELRGEILEWLEGTDLVKYAGVPARRADLTDMLERAIKIVERTRGVLAITPPAPPPPAAPPTAVASAGEPGA